MVAGEASGDKHGADLIQNLKKSFPDLSVAGIGGDKMQNLGVELFYHAKDTAVVGLVEIMGTVTFFIGLYRKMVREINSGKYDAVILIDFPTLNLRFAEKAWKKKIPVFYYISPQVWAWNRSRIPKLAKWLTKMLVILPFEEKIYREAGMDCSFVGHPFLDIVHPEFSREQFCENYQLDPNKKIVGLLPGSRNNEINSLLPVIMESAVMIKREFPEVQFVLPVAPTIPKEQILSFTSSSSLPIMLVEGRTFDVMNAADSIIIASGSATLEAGLIGTPMVIIYKVNPLTYWVGKMLIKVDHIGLVNIVAGKEVAPELIQHEANAQNIVNLTLEYLKDEEKNAQTRKELKMVKETLGHGEASEKAAEEIKNCLLEQKNKEKQEASPSKKSLFRSKRETK